MDVQKAAHRILIEPIESSLIIKIIKPPIRGKNMITDNKGQSVI